MLVNTSAIVLHSFKYKENQMIVDMLTEQLGRISFIVRVGKKGSSATKRQFFQPLTLLELAFDYRENVGLQKLNDIKIAHPFNSIFFDPFKCSIALFVAEFLYHATKSEAQTALLHNYIEAGLLWLDSSTGSFAKLPPRVYDQTHTFHRFLSQHRWIQGRLYFQFENRLF